MARIYINKWRRRGSLIFIFLPYVRINLLQFRNCIKNKNSNHEKYFSFSEILNDKNTNYKSLRMKELLKKI